jgi:DNA-binding XRE family transcriptional regulator
MSTTETIKTVIRCLCGLNQFDADRCRRCRRELHPKPAPVVTVREKVTANLEQALRPLRPRPEHVTAISVAVGHLVRLKRLPLMSQREFADRVGISKALLCLIEGGRTNPSLRVVAEMARVLNMTCRELIGDAELIALDLTADRDAVRSLRFGPQRVTAAEMQERRA